MFKEEKLLYKETEKSREDFWENPPDGINQHSMGLVSHETHNPIIEAKFTSELTLELFDEFAECLRKTLKGEAWKW